MLRELRTHEQHILSARDLIASELRHNAHIVADAAKYNAWTKFREQVSLARWDQYGGELSVLRKAHLELWDDLVSAYEKLKFGSTSWSPGISSSDLDALAERLVEAEL